MNESTKKKILHLPRIQLPCVFPFLHSPLPHDKSSNEVANGIGLNERWLWNTVYNLSKFHSSLLLLLYSVDAFVVLLRSAFIANHENDYRPWTWWVFCVSACMSRTFCFKWMSKPFQNPLNLKYTNQIITNHQTYETWCILVPTNQPTNQHTLLNSITTHRHTK